jgi:hypothetical protein
MATTVGKGGAARVRHLVAMLLAIASVLQGGMLLAAPDADEATCHEEPQVPPWYSILPRELGDGFDWRFKAVGFGVGQGPITSPLNPDNVLKIPRYGAELDLRPDFALKFSRLELSVKPRLELKWMRWKDGAGDGATDTDSDPFVNEWLSRFSVTDKLFVSYGRENLQWGPSTLLAPSNPFNPANGKNNPERELPGLGYARAVWLPDSRWTASLIANTDEGRMDLSREYRRGYALKLDYTGYKKYFSLIPAYQESGPLKLGFFGGWAASDALLLHAEGNFEESEGPSILIGQSYTFEIGPTVTLEYYHNGRGCTNSSILECLYSNGGGFSPDEGLLMRGNYLLLQFVHARIRNAINVTLRWILDIDDGSNRSVAILEYELGDHVKLFTTADYFAGSRTSEFGSLMNYSLMIGAEYNF